MPNLGLQAAYIFILLLSYQSVALESVTLQLKWEHQFQFAGYYMAAEKGFYKDVGLDVNILPANKIDPNTQFQVLAGQAEFGVTHSGLLKARLAGKPFVALAAILQSSPYCWMVKDHGNIKEPSDFKGKRVSHLGQAENAELIVMLQQAGVDIKNLSLYSGTTPMQDFKFGVFDAWQVYITNEPYQMQLQGIKTKQICPKKYGLDVYADILFTHENTVKTKPHLVEKFRAASLKGWRYAMMHMNESIRIIQQKYATDKTLDQLAYEAEKIKPFIVQSGEPIGHMSQTRWQWIAQLYNFTAKEFGQHKTAFIYKEKQKKQHTNWSWMLIVAVVFSLLCIPLYLKLIFFQKKKIELE